MQKVPISCACKINDLEEFEGYLAKEINDVLLLSSISPLWFVPRLRGQSREQPTTVAGQRKRHLPTKVDVLKMHGANVA